MRLTQPPDLQEVREQAIGSADVLPACSEKPTVKASNAGEHGRSSDGAKAEKEVSVVQRWTWNLVLEKKPSSENVFEEVI